MSSNSNSTNRRFFQDTEPGSVIVILLDVQRKYFIPRIGIQPCKVWDETNEKNRRQYEIVFTIMIVLGKITIK